jgi:hypothetical protein
MAKLKKGADLLSKTGATGLTLCPQCSSSRESFSLSRWFFQPSFSPKSRWK